MQLQQQQKQKDNNNLSLIDKFVGCLNQLGQQQQNVAPCNNILDYNKGFINFDVDEYCSQVAKHPNISLQQSAFFTQSSSNLFYKGYKGSLQEHANFFRDLNEQSPQIAQSLAENQLRQTQTSEISLQLLDSQDLNHQFSKSLLDSVSDIKPGRNSTLRERKSSLSTAFNFDIMSGSFIKTDQKFIQPAYKYFNFQPEKVIKRTQLYSEVQERKPQQLLSSIEGIVSELKEISSEDYNKIQNGNPQNTFQNGPGSQSFSNKLIQLSNIKDILSLQSDQVTSRKQGEGLYDMPNYLKTMISQVIDEDKPSEEDDLVQDKIHDWNKLMPLSLIQNNSSSSSSGQGQFKEIRLDSIAPANTQYKNQLNKQFKWAIEDNFDVYNFYDIIPRKNLAVNFEFELDDFQKRAILHLEKRESVLVCAHTSAGKTVVAEYAIALAIKHKKRIIYTSPIKALSNEKYRKLSKKFKDVGILTGDTNINDHASCLIMTTEILRNMLYRQHDIIRDIEWVVFDEVHYMNDEHRGVVWEETIIMLPEHIGIIMLSATVPNYLNFADWVGKTKRRHIYVQITLHRPIPLEHSIYINQKFYMIQDHQGQFLKENYDQILNDYNKAQAQKKETEYRKNLELQEKKDKDIYKDKRSTRQRDRMKHLITQGKHKVEWEVKGSSNQSGNEEVRCLLNLINHCQQHNKLPCVFFIFSKAKILDLCKQIFRKQQLISKSEQSKVVRYFDSVIKRLKPEDQQIQQLRILREMLQHGVAMHHGDLLPIAKEIVEILFSEGLIKVLLATETFAMGINMPTKTVIFWSLKKNDGEKLRFLNSSEYTQMSGRAGRRGIDEKGYVIVFIKEINFLPKEKQICSIIDRQGIMLESKFRVSYKIVLNKLNASDLNITDIMKFSFSENQKPVLQKHLQQRKNIIKLKNQQEQLDQIQCPYQQQGNSLLTAPPIDDYFETSEKIRNINKQYFLQNNLKGLQFPKLVAVLDFNNQIDLGILLNIDMQYDQPFEVLLTKSEISDEGSRKKKRSNTSKKWKINLQYENDNSKISLNSNYNIFFLKASEILEIFSDKFNTGYNKKQHQRIQNNYGNVSSQKKYDDNYLEQAANFLDSEKQYFQEMDIINNQYNDNSQKQQIQQKSYQILCINTNYRKQKDQLNNQLLINSKCHQCNMKLDHIMQIQKRIDIKQRLINEMSKIDETQLLLQNKLDGIIKLLQHFQYIDSQMLPMYKASVAKQIDDNQIQLCELLLDNILDSLNKAEIAALMSGFVCQYKNKDEEFDINAHIYDSEEFSDNFKESVKAAYDICDKVAEQEIRLKIPDDSTTQGGQTFQLNFSMVQVVYLWAKGIDFSQVCTFTNAQEGVIVRVILRLDNLLKNIKKAAKIIGDIKLHDLIQESQQAISRDIVFTESLYLQENECDSILFQNE